jgi:hypothetical protein
MSKDLFSSPGLLEFLREAVKQGRVVYNCHAEKRMRERGFARPDVERALKNGSHNIQKSGYQNGQWRYRITSKTIDGNLKEVVL